MEVVGGAYDEQYWDGGWRAWPIPAHH
jgi:hypothetical protein